MAYATLDRLEVKGFVRSRLGEPTTERGGRAKRFFRVTARGMRAVSATHEALRKHVSGSRAREEHVMTASSAAPPPVAEWLVSLVASPEQTATILGDLLEEFSA